MEPLTEILHLPPGYRHQEQTTTLEWSQVLAKLAAAPRYWLATVRADGRPHVVPVDGVWVDDALYFGGSLETVHERNLRHSAVVSIHLDGADSAVIAEGRAVRVHPAPEEARRLAEATRAKYGYDFGPDAYAAGCWALTPSRVIAWNALPADATRFTWPSA
ncbi:pyridoxamine 5'-phosphate oxidase family protein [Nonomuraea sp. NPDC050404]|uniref:pyridoxamine 5'-phosphate oxidase family protein n=1 Tax=Nonomuraea sp. NPDC050404 TaxID=3155783 RepID=UPI0033FE18A2